MKSKPDPKKTNSSKANYGDSAENGSSCKKPWTTKNDIGPMVRRLRVRRGWSQSKFALKLQFAGLEIDRSGVSKIESRAHHVNERTLRCLAKVLEVSVLALMPALDKSRRFADAMEELANRRF